MKVQYRISLIIIIAGGLFLLLGVWSGLMQIKAASNESEIEKNERLLLKQDVCQENDIPKEAYIPDVPVILQNPSLPAGCEVTALTMLLNYKGVSADKDDLACNYFPCDNDIYEKDGTCYAGNPWQVFVGDPHTQRFGCYAPVIVQTANCFLTEHHSNLWAVDLTGSSIEEIYEKVSQGEPVLVWATIGLEDPETLTQYGWIDKNTGDWFQWVTGEHCYVLKGYTPETVSVCDPIEGERIYNRKLFEQRYETLFRQAVSIESTSEQ